MLPTNRCMPGRSKLLKVLGEFFFFFLLLSGTEDLKYFFLRYEEGLRKYLKQQDPPLSLAHEFTCSTPTLLFHFAMSRAGSHRKTPPSDGVSCALDAPAEVQQSLPEWAKYFSFSGSLRPCLYSPKRAVPKNIRKPDYADHPQGVSMSEQRDKTSHNHIRIYTENELNGVGEFEGYGLRHACQMGREVLDEAGKALRVGVTTDEIDRVVHEACLERDCYPSPLNYYNFPKSVCTSVNEVIVSLTQKCPSYEL